VYVADISSSIFPKCR